MIKKDGMYFLRDAERNESYFTFNKSATFARNDEWISSNGNWNLPVDFCEQKGRAIP